MVRYAPKVPFAMASGNSDFSISDTDWYRIEAAYDRDLSHEVRQRILEVTTSFVLFEVFERTAEPLKDARNRIANVAKAAGQFRSQLIEGRGKGSDARVYADHLIKQNCDDPELLKRLSELLSLLAVACNRALEEIDGPERTEFHRPGECWDLWICSLSTIVREHGLPEGASSDSDKRPESRSPFVRLVCALQECIPLEARRHLQSDFALAKAIQTARRKASGDKIDETP